MTAAASATRVLVERLIFTDLNANNNKFWHAELKDTILTVNWGRVGDKGQTKIYTHSDVDTAVKDFERQVNGKLRKGYTRQKTIVDGAKPSVNFVAKIQIDHSNDAVTSQLINFLVQRNIHNIEGLTNIRMEAGRLTTPLGPVTLEGLKEAEALLVVLSKKDQDFADAANQYLRLIPRNIGRRKIDPRDIFGAAKQLEAEQAMIDSLRAVVRDMEQRTAADIATAPPVFETKLELIPGTDNDWKRIRKYYEKSLNRNHQSYGRKLTSIWRMNIDSATRQFNKDIGNIKELWHGTKDANLLSILKNGYVIPKRNSGIQVTGRMFGDGVYFSDQSTKSLNYATGYWGGGNSQRSFMLLNDVAMGKEFIPKSSGDLRGGKPPKGYDSTFAKAGTSGVMNNEMIVYNTNQIKPTYLCEFS